MSDRNRNATLVSWEILGRRVNEVESILWKPLFSLYLCARTRWEIITRSKFWRWQLEVTARECDGPDA